MATAAERLEGGELGVRVLVRGLELLKDNASNFRFRDQARGALVHVALMPWRTSLAPFELVTDDVERSTVALFERTWRSQPVSELERSLGRTTPLGRENGFSPLVSCAPLSLPGGEGLSLVHRASYRPGSETVSARVLIPVERGTFELSVTTSDQVTGVRESALFETLSLRERPPGFQHLVDDVERDAVFPGHCLSRARDGMHAFLSTVQVTEPLVAPTDQRVVLPHTRVSLVPPPRFALISPGELPLSVNHAAFSRVGFSVAEPPWLFDVTRVECKGSDLEATCIDFYDSWARQGVVQKAVGIDPAPPVAGNRSVRVRFDGTMADGAPLQSRARWIERGGEAFMLALNTEWRTAEDSVALLDAAAETLEWLPHEAEQPRPWWRFW